MIVLTVATPEDACVVTWQDGKIVISESTITARVADFLDDERDHIVGDAEAAAPHVTAAYTTERRLPKNEFEMAAALMQLPYETELDAAIYIHEAPAKKG